MDDSLLTLSEKTKFNCKSIYGSLHYDILTSVAIFSLSVRDGAVKNQLFHHNIKPVSPSTIKFCPHTILQTRAHVLLIPDVWLAIVSLCLTSLFVQVLHLKYSN